LLGDKTPNTHTHLLKIVTMSAARYPLRNRLAQDVSAAAQGELPLSSAGTTNLEPGMVSPPPVPTSGLAPEDEAATVRPEQVLPASASPRLYSDVAASRPSSAASRHDDTQLDAGISEIRSAPNTPHIGEFSSQVDQAFNDNSILLSSTRVLSENPPDKEDNNRPWTLVESKSARRRRSFSAYENRPSVTLRRPTLTSEQETAVKTAEQNLTALEKSRIDRRYENMHVTDDENESSRGEGPLKGKGVDPENWGALKLEPSELDVRAQREAMKTWNMVRDQDQATRESKNVHRMRDAPPHQKDSKYKARVESVSDKDAPKASAPAAANQKPSVSKLTPMSDALMDRVANAVKGHQRPNIHQQ
jgi:hypothetical protein